MKLSKTHILISADTVANGGWGPVLAAAAKGPVSLNQPGHPMDFSWAETLTWILGVESVTGSPSAWSLGVKFQYRLDHTVFPQYSTPRWFDLASENITSDVAEGVGWYGPGLSAPTVANQASSLPVTVKRTIRNHPTGVRVVLDPQFTGGTNPGLYCTLTVTPRG